LAQNLNHQKPEKRRNRKRRGTRRITASDNRRKRACDIFSSLGGTPLENDNELEIYGILQLQWIEEETLSLFTPKMDKACLHDLLHSTCFSEAAELVRDFCS